MANGEAIAYNIASFVCALFLLEFGADKFIDHTAIVAKRTGIPQTIVALLTAGAEWEELAVVVISIARHRSSLAIGNIVGSTISNILGAFSLGLLFCSTSDEGVVFDRSSKLYASVLLGITGLIAGLLGFGRHILWRVVGGVLIGLFAVYLVSVFWAISKGIATAPELSDSDSDDESDDDDGPFTSRSNHGMSRETDALLPVTSNSTSISNDTRHSLVYHVVYLFIGFLALLISAYVLSTAASNLINEIGMSDVLFGVVILSLATTLPEKFVAVVSGFRGHMGIMVANTVGSNIFLLTLCMGILWTSTDQSLNEGTVNAAEISIMLGSTVAMTATVWFGARWVRYIGAAMLAAYVAFIILEFTVIRHV